MAGDDCLKRFGKRKKNCRWRILSSFLCIRTCVKDWRKTYFLEFAKKQINRENISAEIIPKSMYRKNILIPFVDNFIEQLKEKFSKNIRHCKSSRWKPWVWLCCPGLSFPLGSWGKVKNQMNPSHSRKNFDHRTSEKPIYYKKK